MSKIKVIERQWKSLRENHGRYRNGARKVSIQMIALSATIGNIRVLSNWFDANLYQSAFRPVPLTEYIVAGEEVLTTKGIHVRKLKRMETPMSDTDRLACLTCEGLSCGQQVIIFCPSRSQCQSLSKSLSGILPVMSCTALRDTSVAGITHFKSITIDHFNRVMEMRTAAVSSIEDSLDDRNKILRQVLSLGIAFHHAGLSDTQRHMVEVLFREGMISVLIATTTLAAGVNLPAGRVIINGMSVGGVPLGCVQYRQMCGRAGRAGLERYGESFLVVKGAEKERALILSQQEMPDVVSQISPIIDGGRGLLKAILELFNLGLSHSSEDVKTHVMQTLMYAECTSDSQRKEVLGQGHQCLLFLLSCRALEWKPDLTAHNSVLPTSHDPPEQNLVLSRYGKAVSESGINPDEAIVIYEELRCAQENLNLETPLHLIYLITPLNHPLIPDFAKVWKMSEYSRVHKLPFSSILGILDIDESFLFNWQLNAPSKTKIQECTIKLRLSKVSGVNSHLNVSQKEQLSSNKETITLCRLKRLWAATALLRVFEKQPIESVASAYGVSIGDIESLLQSTHVICSQIQRFCGEIGWTSLEAMIRTCREIDLSTTNDVDLENLLKVPGMTVKIAQILHESGITDFKKLASTSPDVVAQNLLLSVSYERKIFESESRDVNSWAMLQERAKMIVDTALHYMQSHQHVEVEDGDESCYQKLSSQNFPWLNETVEDGLMSFKDSQESENNHISMEDIGPFSGENESDEDLDRHTIQLRQTNPITKLMDSKYQCDLSSIHEETDYRELMDPALESKNQHCVETSMHANEPQCVHASNVAITDFDDIDDSVLLAINIDLPTKHEPIESTQEQTTTTGNVDEDDDAILLYVEQVEQEMAVTREKENRMQFTAGTPLEGDHYVDKPESVESSKMSEGQTVSSPSGKDASPYLSAFTPSHLRMKSPAEYLYLPNYTMIQAATETSCKQVFANSSNGSGFKYKSLCDPEFCDLFLSNLAISPCISFELLYRDLPSTFSTVAWSSVSTLKNIKSLHMLSLGNGISLLDAYTVDLENSQSTFQSPHKVLIGASFCFGDENSFYLPLPVPLPMWPLSVNDVSTTSSTSTLKSLNISIEIIPVDCKVLISRYVGYDLVLNKSAFRKNRVLKESSFIKQHNAPVAFSTDSFSRSPTSHKGNPLLYVSKSWVAAARYGLLMEWRKGHVSEWQLMSSIMSNESLVKIAVNLKCKIGTLRERDIIVRGPLMDPTICAKLIEYAAPRRCPPTFPRLRIPSSDSALKNKGNMNATLFRESVSGGYLSISAFRCMSKLDTMIQGTSIANVFHMVEMPSLICVAEAEFAGFPVEAPFFSELRQNLYDRSRLIEYYFSLLSDGKQVNLAVTSLQYLQKLVSHLMMKHGGNTRNEQIMDASREETTVNFLKELISEWRCATIVQPLCSSVLSRKSKRRFDLSSRVRGVFNPVGTETGRLIVSSPSLQTVPHECTYRKCIRPTLHEELITIYRKRDRKEDVKSFIDHLNAKIKNGGSNAEWVRVVKGASNLQAQHNHGQIYEIKCLPLFMLRDNDCESATEGVKLDNNFPEGICEVVVSFDTKSLAGIKRHNETFSADKVTRLLAAINPDRGEMDQLSRLVTGKTLDGSQPQQIIPKTKICPRDGFTCSNGYILLSADYSQIELRLMAHFSSDENLLKAFHDKNADIFKAIASNWHQKSHSAVTAEERNVVKRICYALMYGAGAKLIADTEGCSVDDAGMLMRGFMKKYPGITNFISKVKESTRDCGYVETLLGRRRAIHDIKSSDQKSRLRAERQAVNTLCQGSAADLIKLAIVNIFHEFSCESRFSNVRRIKSNPGGGLYRDQDCEVRFLLQIHDELLFEVREDCMNIVAKTVKNCMENALNLKVPLQIQLKIGKTWGKLEHFSCRVK